MVKAQEEIKGVEASHAAALREDAQSAYEGLGDKGRLRTVTFPDKELGVSFILARFDAIGSEDACEQPRRETEHSAALSRRLVVVETTRPLGIARRMLAPTLTTRPTPRSTTHIPQRRIGMSLCSAMCRMHPTCRRRRGGRVSGARRV